jgi:hypothetical protein
MPSFRVQAQGVHLAMRFGGLHIQAEVQGSRPWRVPKPTTHIMAAPTHWLRFPRECMFGRSRVRKWVKQ